MRPALGAVGIYLFVQRYVIRAAVVHLKAMLFRNAAATLVQVGERRSEWVPALSAPALK